jgi:hypothetical protein
MKRIILFSVLFSIANATLEQLEVVNLEAWNVFGQMSKNYEDKVKRSGVKSKGMLSSMGGLFGGSKVVEKDPQVDLNELAQLNAALNSADIATLAFLKENCKADGLLEVNTDPGLCEKYPGILLKQILNRLDVIDSQVMRSNGILKGPSKWLAHVLSVTEFLKGYDAEHALDYNVRQAIVRVMSPSESEELDRNPKLAEESAVIPSVSQNPTTLNPDSDSTIKTEVSKTALPTPASNPLSNDAKVAAPSVASAVQSVPSPSMQPSGPQTGTALSNASTIPPPPNYDQQQQQLQPQQPNQQQQITFANQQQNHSMDHYAYHEQCPCQEMRARCPQFAPQEPNYMPREIQQPIQRPYQQQPGPVYPSPGPVYPSYTTPHCPCQDYQPRNQVPFSHAEQPVVKHFENIPHVEKLQERPIETPHEKLTQVSPQEKPQEFSHESPSVPSTPKKSACPTIDKSSSLNPSVTRHSSNEVLVMI